MSVRISQNAYKRLKSGEGLSPHDVRKDDPRAIADYAVEFAVLIDRFAPDLSDYLREQTFIPERRWRFDLTYPQELVAVEIDGGAGKARGGRHMSLDDYTKLNTASALGWRILRFQPAHFGTVRRGRGWESDLRKFPACVALIRQARSWGRSSV